jgi:hypothetical protein
MTAAQQTLAEATTAYVEASRAFATALSTPGGVTIEAVRPYWDAERTARHAYAAAHEAEGHAAPVGLLWDK